MFQKEFSITNLSCGACVKLSTMALKDIPGVTAATVDLSTGKTSLTAEREISKEEINKALQEVEKTTDL
jgi:copper chaperone CopZ